MASLREAVLERKLNFYSPILASERFSANKWPDAKMKRVKPSTKSGILSLETHSISTKWIKKTLDFNFIVQKINEK